MKALLAACAMAMLSGAAAAQPKAQTLSVIIFPGGFNLPTWAAERQGLAEGRFDIATVLALRSKYTGRQLGDPAKYIDPSYRAKAL